MGGGFVVGVSEHISLGFRPKIGGLSHPQDLKYQQMDQQIPLPVVGASNTRITPPIGSMKRGRIATSSARCADRRGERTL
jgi:hypothetical protein